MRPIKLVSIMLVPALFACKKDKAADKEAPTSKPTVEVTATTGSGSATPEPTTPAPSGKPFEASFEGKPYKLTNARIDYSAGNDRLMLSTGALPCGEDTKAEDVSLEMTLPVGPGGKHFAGIAYAVNATLYSETQKFVIGNDYLDARIEIQPGEWKTGGKVKALLHVDATDDDKKAKYTGDGMIEAEVCDLSDESRYTGSPEVADKGPASGAVQGESFTFKSGIAEMMGDEGDKKISMITLYAQDADCTNKTGKGTYIIIGGTSGAKEKDVVVGKPQPRQLSYRLKGEGAQYFVPGEAWVQFDAIELKPGAVIKGSVFGEATPSEVKLDPKKAAKLSGTFTATVCD